ncbi:MAG: hypothetical protein ABJA60_00270 [Nitrosospira sp.]
MLPRPAPVTDITRTESAGFNSEMARKRHRLKILSALPISKLRIARPSFVEQGSNNALTRTVKILGPFPTPEPAEAARKERDFLLFETVQDAETVCREIGEHYFQNLVEEQTAPRLPEVLRNFDEICSTAAKLSKILAHLSYAERHLLHDVWGVHPPEFQEALAERVSNMGALGPPSKFEITQESELAPGALSDALTDLSNYVGILKSIITRRYARSPDGRVDLGGQTSASNIVAPNPRWHLIHSACEIFSRIESLEVKLSEGNSLQKFVAGIHEWVTGEEGASFETPIKDYMELRKLRDITKVRYEVLRSEGKTYSVQAFDAAIQENAPGVPRKVRARAKEILAEISAIDDTMQYGHRIPARQLVTG